MAGEEAAAARHVKRPRGCERRHVALELAQVFLPAWPVPLGEAAHPEVPLVVFGSAVVVVLLHHLSSWHRLLIDSRTHGPGSEARFWSGRRALRARPTVVSERARR